MGHDADFASVYGAFTAGLIAQDCEPIVLEAACTNLFDTLACAIAGARAQGVAEVRDLVVGWGGSPQSLVWGSSDRVPAHNAAWVNSVMAHARDFDDTDDVAVLHAGVSVVPAALSAAALRPEATGADLLAGIIAGLELMCRIGRATTIGIIDSGFIYSSLLGYFGAAAASARVLGFDADMTVNTMGIAYSQASGTHQVTRDAATTKRMQPGLAAQTAVVAAQLAGRGIRGAQATFEGVDGLFRTYLSDRVDSDALRQDLGEHFEFTDLSYKRYPCCRFNHTAIDAALALREHFLFEGPSVERITARVSRQSFEAVCTPVEMRHSPPSVVAAQFSLPFTVACALVDGCVTLEHFTPLSIRRQDLLAVAGKVECVVDPDIDKAFGRGIAPVDLTMTTTANSHTVRVDVPLGHPLNPLSTQAFDRKLTECIAASGLDWPSDQGMRMRSAIDSLLDLQSAKDLNALMQPNSKTD